MTSHRPPAPTRPSRLWLGLMAAAVTGIVAGTVAAGHASAPKVAADERLALTPERTPEPVAHGGPLVLPSVGVLPSSEQLLLTEEHVGGGVHTSRTAQRRSAAPVRTLRVTGTPQTTPQAVSGDLGAITSTSEPTVTEPTQAATTTPTETAATTTAATTTTEATTTTATTGETATVSVTVSATQTTEAGQ